MRDCNGRPSIDPVVLFKMVLIQHLYGLPSLRRTAEEVSANNCYPDIACPVCGGDVNSWDKRCSRALGYRQIVCEGCISEEYQVTVENLRYVMENHFGLVPCPGI